jgi:hypothetical protein
MEFGETVNQCGDIVKLFKRSPSRNKILQMYVKLLERKALRILLDLKIRWSSIEKMLMRSLRILKLIEDTLDDINRTDMWEPENTETHSENFETTVFDCKSTESPKL